MKNFLRAIPPFSYLSSLLFMGHYLWAPYHSYVLLHSYLDDLLCPAIVLGPALALGRTVIPGDPEWRLPRAWGLWFVLWYSMLFEALLPLFDARHYADPWDILAYGLGTVLFYLWANRKPASAVSPLYKSR
jgi:hypothetical protein